VRLELPSPPSYFSFFDGQRDDHIGCRRGPLSLTSSRPAFNLLSFLFRELWQSVNHLRVRIANFPRHPIYRIRPNSPFSDLRLFNLSPCDTGLFPFFYVEKLVLSFFFQGVALTQIVPPLPPPFHWPIQKKLPHPVFSSALFAVSGSGRNRVLRDWSCSYPLLYCQPPPAR